MIITCDKCSTRFNLDDSFVKADGSKVRCSVCKHIFTAFPPTPEPVSVPEEQPSEITSDLDIEANDFSLDDSGMDFEDTELEMEEPETVTDFQETEIELEIDSDDFEMETGAEPDTDEIQIGEDAFEEISDDIDFDTDDDQPLESEPGLEMENDFDFQEGELELDDEEDEAPLESLEIEESPDTPEEDVSLQIEDADVDDIEGLEFEPLEDDDPALEMGVVTELQEEDEIEEDDSQDDGLVKLPEEDEDDFELEFDISDESETGTETDDEGVLTLDDDSPELDAADQDMAATEENFEQYDQVLQQETEPGEEEPEPGETVEIEDVEALEAESEISDSLTEHEEKSSAARRRKKKKPIIGAPILILLLICLLVVGAYIASLMTGYKIPYLSDVQIPFLEKIFKKPAPQQPEKKPTPNQKSVNGRFVNNTSAGTLFVITGTVDNPSKTVFRHIKIKGALITQGKVEAKTKSVYCGNIISEEDLKKGNITEIDKTMSNKDGTHGANAGVKPGTSIPFMVVFADLPDKLQNFTVKVVGSEKVPKK